MPLEKTCCKHADAEIQAQSLRYRCFSQIGLFENLPAHPSVLREETLELHHQTSLFVEHFENLVSRGGDAVKIVRNNIVWTHGRDWQRIGTKPLGFALWRLLLCTRLSLLLPTRRGCCETSRQEQCRDLPQRPAKACTLFYLSTFHSYTPQAHFRLSDRPATGQKPFQFVPFATILVHIAINIPCSVASTSFELIFK